MKIGMIFCHVSRNISLFHGSRFPTFNTQRCRGYSPIFNIIVIKIVVFIWIILISKFLISIRK